jgi:glucan 1,3-beta-glucosidase
MTPKFFTGSELGWGGSLCGMCQWNASETSTRMRSHLKSWITERDFSEIKSQGFNSVRLPIGYWNLISDPYHLYAPSDVTESLEVIDWCFEMATKYNLLVLLDLHGAPGSQNGIDHSGCAMSPNWTHPLNINLSLEAVGVMARRYGKHPQLLGLELMNEPGWPIENKSHSVLLKYYYDSYHIIRESSSTALVVFNELYESYYSAWGGELLEPDYYNVVVDWHLYDWQEPYTKRNITQHIDDAHRWRPLIRDHSLFPFHPIIVGEWCMSTGTFVQAGQPFVDASLDSFAESLGWFLWNWKVEKGINFDEWDVQLQLSLPEGLRISLPR